MKSLILYSLECRQDSNVIIYAWKILKVLVPNVHPKIIPRQQDKRARYCGITPLKSRGTIKTKEKCENKRGPEFPEFTTCKYTKYYEPFGREITEVTGEISTEHTLSARWCRVRLLVGYRFTHLDMIREATR